MNSLGQQISDINSRGLSAPRTLTINLADVAIDKEINITGTSFYIFSAPDQTSYVSVRVGRKDADSIDYTLYTGFRAPFTKLYLTTPAAQAGLIQIIIAAEEPGIFELIDNRSAISASMNAILEELKGDIAPETVGTEKTVGLTAVQVLAANANRKGAMVQAKDSNAGIIYIGFDNTVTTTKWVAELQAGMSWPVDDYRGPIFAIADTAAQLLGWGEW